MGDYTAIILHTFEMGAGFRVPRFGQLGKSQDRHVAGLQTNYPAADIHAHNQFSRIKRLMDVIIRTDTKSLDCVFGSGLASEQYEVDVAVKLTGANGTAQLHAIHSRHFPVRDDQAVLSAAEDIQGLLSVPRRGYFITRLLERMGG